MPDLNKPLVEIKNVDVYRGETKVLDKFSLNINYGEHVAILGPNGCGKSTLLGLLSRKFRALPRKDAFVKVNGEAREDVFELRKTLGIVSDNELESIIPEVTVAAVVLSGFFASTAIFPDYIVTKAQVKKVEEILAQLEIESLSDRAFIELSSGQKKRVLLARALVHDPKVLIFDEVSNSLDMKAQAEMIEITRGLARTGKTIVMVTHHLEEIFPEIERVVMIKDGKIFKDGKKEAVLTKKNIEKLFNLK